MTAATPDRQLTINGRTYLLRLVAADRGRPARVAAWCDGREVRTIGLDGFLADAAPDDAPAQAAAVALAFERLARDLIRWRP